MIVTMYQFYFGPILDIPRVSKSVTDVEGSDVTFRHV
jgi:hypothetical protein